MDFSLFATYWPILLKGLLFTLYICSLGIVFTLVGGLLLHLMSRIKLRIISFTYVTYLTIFRGSPLLVQVYLMYYGAHLLSLN